MQLIITVDSYASHLSNMHLDALPYEWMIVTGCVHNHVSAYSVCKNFYNINGMKEEYISLIFYNSHMLLN